eukprot:UN20219
MYYFLILPNLSCSSLGKNTFSIGNFSINIWVSFVKFF